MIFVNKWLKFIISIGISGVGLYYAFGQVDFDELWLHLKSVDLSWMAIATVLLIFSVAIRAERWQLLLEPIDNIRFHPLFAATMIGYFGNVVFGPPIVGKTLVAMDYDIPIMGYSGKMTILKNGQPKNIKIMYGPNQSIDLNVSSYTKGKIVLYHTFSPRAMEVIDLRE